MSKSVLELFILIGKHHFRLLLRASSKLDKYLISNLPSKLLKLCTDDDDPSHFACIFVPYQPGHLSGVTKVQDNV